MTVTNVGAPHELKATAEGTAAGTQCRTCRNVHLPARRHRCLGCGSKGLAPTPVELCGVFESWTLLQTGEREMGAWALGLVRLDAGPMLTVRVRITDVPLHVGARVEGAIERTVGEPERFWFEVLPPADEELPERTEVAA
jgi:uncharacterized OB-fold protein